LDKYAFKHACRDGGAAIEQALRELDRAYFGVLYREAMRGLGDPDAARDLVQETFIKVWQRCATFQGESELLPWVKSILRHGLIDRLRREGREVPLQNEPDEPAPEVRAQLLTLSAEAIPTPDAQVRRDQLEACFRRCWEQFERAAPSHALVMSWIVEDGLTHEQVAALLGRTPGATREFLSQCRKRARIHLAEWRELACAPEST
jgi:RNA polymerase sigma factor (sigma-70 family)